MARLAARSAYGSLDALCKAELAQDVRGVRAALAQARALIAQPLAAHGGYQDGRVDNIKSRSGGTSADYLVARLARDHPDYLQRLQRGEYRSVLAAARDAGIPHTDRINLVPTVANFARAIRAKLTHEQIAELIAELNVRVTPEECGQL